MNPKKKKALEAAGWRVGDAADFLEMSDDERQLLEVRLAMALSLRRQRKVARLTQQQLATRMKTSQPRITKIEQAAEDVSLDQILSAFTVAGGRVVVRVVASKGTTSQTDKPVELQIDLVEGEG